ncbi:MAG: phosphoenolpyruvate synthase [Gemmatimonadota bacterium]
MAQPAREHIRWFETLTKDDVAIVGGKNASLGEMVRELAERGVRVPDGFATTADAYRELVDTNALAGDIERHLAAWRAGTASLEVTGTAIREGFLEARLPSGLVDAVTEAYRELSARYGVADTDVAVRSSATAEDLPEASFAGQQESYLNVAGEDALLDACRRCFASLFTDRAITYRETRGYDHLAVALSIGVQKMVRSDRAGAGVLFTIDTDTGFPDVVVINAAWGLGEFVVKGVITPDQYTVFKPFLDDASLTPIIGRAIGSKAKKLVYASQECEAPGAEETGVSATTVIRETSEIERRSCVLSDAEILKLARWGAVVEAHYGRPMDVEWAKDGDTEDLFIVQARPETVQSRREAGALRSYSLKESGDVIARGLAVGDAIASGEACVLESAEAIGDFRDGSILVTRATDPDWGPVMRRAAAIVTDEGGRTSHASIVSRELGIPAIVGTENATEALKDGRDITVSCAEGDEGRVYDGLLRFDAVDIDLDDLVEPHTAIMINIADPGTAMRWWRLPCRGVGLARVEYLVNNVIQVHPMALARFEEVEDDEARERIAELTSGYDDPTEYFVERLALGVGTIAASRFPDPVIVRTSDFKTNEYARLVGGEPFEPQEENPMLGWRGASRYYDDGYREGFALECRALRRVREEMGFRNVIVMIPFCRTPDEADRVLAEMARHGLERGRSGLQVYVMAEIPSNVLEVGDFARRFDGFSIGSNDLTQLALGVDRDSTRLAHLFDERSPTVRKLIRMLLAGAHAGGRPVGICGQAPGDRPDFARFLVRAGIDSISLNPDSVFRVTELVAEEEASNPRSSTLSVRRNGGERATRAETRGEDEVVLP